MKLHFVFYFCVLLILAGCESRFVDISNQQQPISFEFPEKDPYRSFAWISEDQIVFNHTIFLDVPLDDIVIPELHVYDLKKQTWRKIRVGEGECRGWLKIGGIQRLPNGNLGYWRTCTENGRDFIKRQEMNIESGKVADIDIKPIVEPGMIAYSPDMTEFIQHSPTNGALQGELFYMHKDVKTQLVPHFFRAMGADWSPHRREILFLGLEQDPTDPSDSQPIWQKLLSHPNDLYISTPEGKDVKKILSSVFGYAKWSPKDNVFAFAGEIFGVGGIWLVNPENMKIIKIWNKSSDFAWSPDGQNMLIVEDQRGEKFEVIAQTAFIIPIKTLP